MNDQPTITPDCVRCNQRPADAFSDHCLLAVAFCYRCWQELREDDLPIATFWHGRES
jgi:hypothetical protein